MSDRSRYQFHAVVISAGLLAIWLLSSEPWGLRAYQLLAFTAPGALLGLGSGWMASAGHQSEWTWRAARKSAVLGAAVLPPFLAFFIAVNGNVQPQRLLAGFVYAAWIALFGGAAVAIVRRIER
jgi:hypothetical protein